MTRHLLTGLLVAATALLTATTAPAAVKPTGEPGTCSVMRPAAPTLDHGIVLGGFAKCNAKWRATALLETETGGVWGNGEYDNPVTAGGAIVPPHTTRTYAGGTEHNTMFRWGGLDQTPYCSRNWRALVTYYDRATGNPISQRTSGTLTKSCPA